MSADRMLVLLGLVCGLACGSDKAQTSAKCQAGTRQSCEFYPGCRAEQICDTSGTLAACACTELVATPLSNQAEDLKHLGMDETHVYWESRNRIARVAKGASSSAEQEVFLETAGTVSCMAVGPTYVYVGTDNDSDGVILARYAKDGQRSGELDATLAATLGDALCRSVAIGLHDTYALVSTLDSGTVLRLMGDDPAQARIVATNLPPDARLALWGSILLVHVPETSVSVLDATTGVAQDWLRAPAADQPKLLSANADELWYTVGDALYRAGPGETYPGRMVAAQRADRLASAGVGAAYVIFRDRTVEPSLDANLARVYGLNLDRSGEPKPLYTVPLDDGSQNHQFGAFMAADNVYLFFDVYDLATSTDSELYRIEPWLLP